jgi:hypothetical protein
MGRPHEHHVAAGSGLDLVVGAGPRGLGEGERRCSICRVRVTEQPRHGPPPRDDDLGRAVTAVIDRDAQLAAVTAGAGRREPQGPIVDHGTDFARFKVTRRLGRPRRRRRTRRSRAPVGSGGRRIIRTGKQDERHSADEHDKDKQGDSRTHRRRRLPGVQARGGRSGRSGDSPGDRRTDQKSRSAAPWSRLAC